MKFKYALFAVIAALLVMAALPLSDVSNMDGLHLQGSFGTATPALLVDQQGTGAIFELRDNATPVMRISDGGGVQFITGTQGDTPSSYTLTGSQTLTPTVKYYEVAPSAVLTLTIAGGSAGDDLIIANTVTTSTVILDTGATVGGGNITLGENDIAIFKKVDDTWAEVASPDNS